MTADHKHSDLGISDVDDQRCSFCYLEPDVFLHPIKMPWLFLTDISYTGHALSSRSGILFQRLRQQERRGRKSTICLDEVLGEIGKCPCLSYLSHWHVFKFKSKKEKHHGRSKNFYKLRLRPQRDREGSLLRSIEKLPNTILNSRLVGQIVYATVSMGIHSQRKNK